jgi:hypothetical protein
MAEGQSNGIARAVRICLDIQSALLFTFQKRLTAQLGRLAELYSIWQVRLGVRLGVRLRPLTVSVQSSARI